MRLVDRLEALEAAAKTNPPVDHPAPKYEEIIERIKAESRLPLELRIERLRAETYQDHRFISARQLEAIRDLCVRHMEEALHG
jgi:hypothetical protein